jgi:hypothetical protein
VPLVVDGRRTSIAGRTFYGPGSTALPWIALAALLAAVGALVAAAPWRRLRRAASLGLAAASLSSLLVAAAGTWLDAPRATGDSAILIGGAVVLLALGVGAMAFAEAAAAPFVTLAVAAVSTGAAATFASVLTHRFPVSVLPDTVARGVVAGAVGLGIAAVIVTASDLARHAVARRDPAV